MQESEMVRTQIEAAFYYVNKLHNDYKIDIRSCRFYARLFSKFLYR